jgi:uncharacterized membrane protein
MSEVQPPAAGQRAPEPANGPMGVIDTTRTETFSDGVFAIAITLLVLELHVPNLTTDGGLWHALTEEWPSFSAYLVSFLVIGIMWVNHHAMFRVFARIDRIGLFINLVLLMFTALLPFSTALMSRYLDEGNRNAHVAAAVYSANLLAAAIAFSLLWLYAVRGGRLVAVAMTPAEERVAIIRYGIGVLIYAATVALAFVSAPLTLAVQLLIALYYCFDQLGARARKRR